MTNPIEYIQRLEAEADRLQNIIRQQLQQIADIKTDSFSRGFKAGRAHAEQKHLEITEINLK